MAYSKAKISIPNVTGNIVITATATSSTPTFSFTMDRILTGGRTESGEAHTEWIVTPPNESYAFSEFLRNTATQGSGSTTTTITTNMTANGVNITNCAGGYGICYPFKAKSGKTYTFTLTASGDPRVSFGWWTDGSWGELSASRISTAGTHTVSLVAPTGTVVWGGLDFGAGTNGDAQFTGVSITES